MKRIRNIDFDFALLVLCVTVFFFMVPGCVYSALKAGSAFYEQVILKQPHGFKLPPIKSVPVESFDFCRHYCGLNKTRVPSMPQTITV